MFDKPISYRVRNAERRWWQLWKPRWTTNRATLREIQQMRNTISRNLLAALVPMDGRED